MKDIIKSRSAHYYNVVLESILMLAGVVLTFVIGINDEGSISGGIISALVVIILGTACFLIYPVMLYCITLLVRLLPMLAIPYWVILAFSSIWEFNTVVEHGYTMTFVLSLIASSWGLFNLLALISSTKEYGDKFSFGNVIFNTD